MVSQDVLPLPLPQSPYNKGKFTSEQLIEGGTKFEGAASVLRVDKRISNSWS